MRKKNQFAGLLSLGLMLIFSETQAQTYNNQVIVANGGEFEFSAPYNDRATIGTYNPSNKQYTVFDTIHVESVNGLAIETNHAYLGAFDSIIKYDIDNYSRVTSVNFNGINNVALAGNYLFASKYNYMGAPLMEALDKNSLTTIHVFDSLEKNIGGVVVLNDSIYIASNVLGTVDQFPPYQIFLDTLGYLSVFNATTGVFARKIALDTSGSGINELAVYNNKIYGVCGSSGNVVAYDPASNALSFDQVAASELIGVKANALILNTLSGIYHYNMDTKSSVATGLSQSYTRALMDTVNNEYYFSQTDYTSFGKTFIYDVNGALTDSFVVNISPEAMAVDYRLSVGIESVKEELPLSLYPNPTSGALTLRLIDETSDIQIFDGKGRLVFEQKNLRAGNHRYDFSFLQQGVYHIRVIANHLIHSARFVKQ